MSRVRKDADARGGARAAYWVWEGRVNAVESLVVLERLTCDQEVLGSIPDRRGIFSFRLCNLSLTKVEPGKRRKSRLSRVRK